MAEKGQTSSMTSVTEEDTSADSESDTTESSYSNVTSSVLSSTDTDDKLTPSLINISITNSVTSNTSSPSKKRKQPDAGLCGETANAEGDIVVKMPQQEVKNTSSVVKSTQVHNVHPYGTNPLSLWDAQDKKRRKKNTGLHMLEHAHLNTAHCQWNESSTFCKENLGVDDTDNKLSTDFSDTSSIPGGNNASNNNNFNKDDHDDSGSTGGEEASHDERPFLPDMSSASWYQARCFDQYWSHYNFVMEWYQAHVQAVTTLQRQMIGTGTWGYPARGRYAQSQHQPFGEKPKKSKRSKRASQRRSTRARQRAKQDEGASVSVSATDTDDVTSAASRERNGNIKAGEEDGELEMEITEEMMEFFTTSFKHRMERDGAKQGEDDGVLQNIEGAKAGQQGPSSAAPSEQPGVRRTAEMRELYGEGAPMIHGMETALQMTYDRISDRFQPKLWPNMPLKIVFA